jgi:regulator of protease activity HflC (stomatin/prohibitin superfamily)
MTTEEFYDASIREDKALRARDEMNQMVRPFGLEVRRVIPEKFRFHPEYEEKIRAKKLADQEVEEQISKANAALQDQIFRTVEATKKKEVFIAGFSGQMEQLIVQAKANANRNVKEAEAYSIATTRGADAQFYEKEQNAKALFTQKEAEAEAIRQRADALSGEGGRNIVKLEYAQRLNQMKIKGQPFTINSASDRFIHTKDAAASSTQR